MPVAQLFFLVLMFFVVLIGSILNSRAEHKRRVLLKRFAEQQGLTFDPREDSDVDSRFFQFGCFDRGDNRYGYNHMHGTWHGWDVWCFDYHYETTSTDSDGNTTTHHHSSHVIFDVGGPVQPLNIRSEGFFDRVAGFLGFDDIDFESAEFSREFHVKSPDKKWAYDVISQKTMEILLDSPRFRIEMGGRHLLVRRDSRFTPAGYHAAMRLGWAVVDGIPRDALRGRS